MNWLISPDGGAPRPWTTYRVTRTASEGLPDVGPHVVMVPRWGAGQSGSWRVRRHLVPLSDCRRTLVKGRRDSGTTLRGNPDSLDSRLRLSPNSGPPLRVHSAFTRSLTAGMPNTHEAPPRAAMLIESMRDIGYSLETALADVIDNSITAGATEIRLLVDNTGTEPRIGILDNGSGMSREQLLEAMRLGSSDPRATRPRTDLGRFGLGMKTASFSQCRRMTVAARKGAKTSVAIWDLDHVEDEDRWELLTPSSPQGVPFADQLVGDGALVVWERMDRVVEAGGSEAGKKHFNRRLDETRRHLELVFHRFLAGEPGTARVTILLNELPLKPFDPFHSRQSEASPPELVQVGEHTVEITAYTLPHHRSVTKADWEHYGGPEGYLKTQGFYLYREKRLIVHGTWFGLARQMELTKLCRVKIDTPNGLDAEWQVDVKKASARPPLPLRERLQKLISEIGAPSKRKYVGRAQKQVHGGRLPVWTRTVVDNRVTFELNAENPVVADFRRRLPDDLALDLDRLLRTMSAALPLDIIFADLAGEPESVRQSTMSPEDLERAFTVTLSGLVAHGVSVALIPDMLRRAEPFRSNWTQVESFLNEIVLGDADVDAEEEDD